jgi:hypothetical protein
MVLGGLRIGWGYGPRHVIDVLNRVRGPFNLSTTAAGGRRGRGARSGFRGEVPQRKHPDAVLAWPNALAEIGVPSDTSMANFILARFASQEEAEACDAFLQERGLIVRRWRATSCRIACGSPSVTNPPAAGRPCHRAVQGREDGCLRTGRADRAGADRLVHGACDEGAWSGGRDRGLCAIGRDAGGGAGDRLSATGSGHGGRGGGGADLVVLAVPVGAMGAIAAEIGPHLAPGATVTDVGSVKQAVIDAVAPHMPEGVHFIPGHPLAGTEHSGPHSGFATLFQNRWWLLTPEGADVGRWRGCARCGGDGGECR